MCSTSPYDNASIIKCENSLKIARFSAELAEQRNWNTACTYS